MHTLFSIIPRIARICSGGSLVNRFRIIVVCWYVLVASEIFSKKVSCPILLCFKEQKYTFFCTSKADIAVLKEVFVDEEYRFDVCGTPTSIFDFGAHVGDTALYFHACYPKAIIYALEPNPALFERLLVHVKHMPQIIPIHVALGETSGTTTLFISKRSSLRGSLQERSGSEVRVTVPQLSMKDILRVYSKGPVDLCKFDIEGGERNLFLDSRPHDIARCFIGEYHEDLVHEPLETFKRNFEGYQLHIEPLRRKGRFKIQAIRK